MISTLEGWLYLAVVLDVYSRRVIGWAMEEREDEELVTLTLRMALARRKPDTHSVCRSCTIQIEAVNTPVQAIRHVSSKRG
jgi:putative transposase